MNALIRRPGFKLRELSVVIAMGTICMMLIVPALARARAGARSDACADNMRNVGLLLYAYIDAYGKFPPGVNNPKEVPNPTGNNPKGWHPWWSWRALVTEFYGDGKLYHLADTHAKNVTHWPWATGAAKNPALAVPLPIWICPADDPSRYQKSFGNLTDVAYAAYLGVSGIADEDKRPISNLGSPRGVLFLLSKVQLKGITDGLSNTVVVGERPPALDQYYGWWFAGAGFSGLSVKYVDGFGYTGMNNYTQKGTGDAFLGAREEKYWMYLSKQTLGDDPSCDGRMKLGLAPGSTRGFCDQAHFWSLHEGGANFLFADGSVKFITYDQNDILPALCTRSGDD
jgi:prepilin-type processing-associated H-X9-DG protein